METIENLFLKLKSEEGLHHVLIMTPKTSAERRTLTVDELQQIPVIEKTDSNEEISSLIWTLHKGSRKLYANFKTDTENFTVVVYR